MRTLFYASILLLVVICASNHHANAAETEGIRAKRSESVFSDVLNGAKKTFEGASEWVSETARETGNWVQGAAKDTGDWVENAVHDTGRWIKEKGEALDDSRS